MKLKKIIIPIGSIKVLGITYPSTLIFMVKVFECLIKNTRTERYKTMCSIIAHNKQQPVYVDNEISGGGKPIPKNTTTEAL